MGFAVFSKFSIRADVFGGETGLGCVPDAVLQSVIPLNVQQYAVSLMF
jgi:hypothetical protein